MDNAMKQRLSRIGRVAVLAGGVSAERSVSLKSGAAVHQALRQLGLIAELVDPADSGVANGVFNAANEIAVAAFVAGKIRFVEIYQRRPRLTVCSPRARSTPIRSRAEVSGSGLLMKSIK